MIVLAADMGGSHVTCAVVQDCSVVGKTTLQIGNHARTVDFDLLMQQVAAAMDALLQEHNVERANVAGIVIGFPGIVDAPGAHVLETLKKYDAAKSFDFDAWGKQYFALSVILENDARLALMGEHACGAARGFTDAALITLGTGIGGAAILNHRPLRSQDGRAGCLGGHLPVQIGGRPCVCGNIGCAEAESGTWALAGIASSMQGYENSSLRNVGEGLNFESLFTHADAGDAVAIAVLERCYTVWSTLSVAIFHAYAPQVLLFGGSVMKRGENILPHIQNYVAKYGWSIAGAQVQAAQLGPDAALFGAVARWQEAPQ